MSLTIDTEKLLGFLKHFHTMTGLRISLFDLDFNELVSSGAPSAICQRIKACKQGLERCRACDISAQLFIKETKDENYIYTCHSGLVDAIAPITDGDDIIGYMMIGQCLSKDTDLEEAWENTRKICSAFTQIDDLRSEFFSLPRLTKEQIRACVYLMNACASYVRLKNYVKINPSDHFSRIKHYINTNLSSDLSSELLCAQLLIPRNSLFKVVKQQTGMTLGQYIQFCRLEYAKKLLEDTEETIAQISEQCGVNDFNYFSRLFKKQYGITPREYRKQQT